MATPGAMLDIAGGTAEVPKGPEAPSDAAPTAKAPSLGKQWNTFLGQPGNAAAMIQFGIKAMQPISPGQSVMGHIGNAIGAAGEAKQRVTQTRTDTRAKEAQTNYYEGRNEYYSGGRLTANQELLWAAKQDANYGEILDGVAFNMGGINGISDLTSEQLAEAKAQTDQIYRQRYRKEPPSPGATAAPSLGEAIAPPPQYPVGTVLRNSTTGETSTLTNDGWVTS